MFLEGGDCLSPESESASTYTRAESNGTSSVSRVGS